MIGNKKKIIASFVIVLLSISIIASWYFFNSQENDTSYYTMQELIEDGLNSNDINRSEYLVKDKITYIKQIKLPEYSISQKQETHNYSVEFNTDTDIKLLSVGFKSVDNHHVFFSVSNDYNFKENAELTFTVPVKKFPSLEYGESGQSWNTTPPIFYYYLWRSYRNQVSSSDVEVADISKEASINNKTNSFHCNLTFNSISDFYPYPVNWDDVSIMGKDNLKEDFDDYYIKVYDGNNYLAPLYSNKTKLNKSIEVGDSIEIACFNYTGKTEYFPILLETEHPSNLGYKVTSPFPLTPRYDIYFEG